MRTLPLTVLILLATGTITFAADPKTTPDFATEIFPLLKRNCLACHNATKAKADLILETPADMIKGGDTGPALVPGDADASFLFTTSAHIEEPTMPPEKNKSNAKQLTPQELDLLKAWINAGAEGGPVIAAAPENWRALSGPQPVYTAAITADGRFAAAGRGQQIQIYDLLLGQATATLLDPEIADAKAFPKGAAHHDLVQALAFSPYGDLASGGYRVAKIWRRSEPSRSGDVAVTTKVSVSAHSPDQGWQAFGAADGSLSLVDAKAAELKPETTKLPGGAITGLAFRSDGGALAATTADGKLHLRDTAVGAKPKTLALAGAASAVAFVEQNKTIASGGANGVIRLTPLADFDPKPAPKPAPQPAPKPTPAPTPKPEAKPATPAPKPEAKPATPAPKPEAKPAAPAPKPEAPAPKPAAEAKDPNACADDEPAKPAPAPTPAPTPAASAPKPAPAAAPKPAPAPAAAPTPAPVPAPILELKGHTQPLISLLPATADGSQLLAVHKDGTVVHWDVAGRKEIRRIAHGSEATLAVISADASKLLTVGAKAPAKLWQLSDGKLLADITHTPAIQGAIDERTRGIDVETRLAAHHTKAAETAATETKAESDKAAEAAEAAATQRRELGVKQAALAELQRKEPAASEEDLTKAAAELTVARRALTASERNRDLGIRLSAAAAERQAAALAAAKLAESTKAVLTSEIEALKKQQAEADTQPVLAAAFSPDGTQVALLRKNGDLERWLASATPTWLETSTTGTTDAVAIRWRSVKDLWLVRGDAKPIERWDLSQPWKLLTRLGDGKDGEIFPDRVSALGFDPAGTSLLTGSGVPSRSGEWKLWDIAAGTVITESLEAHSDTLSDFSFSPDGERFASAGTDRMVKIWNTRSGELEHTFEGHSGHVLCVDWSPDGRTLASGSGDLQVKLWDIESGEQKSKVEGFGKEVTSVGYIGSSDTLLTASGDSVIKVNNQPLPSSAGFVHEAKLSADGKLAVAGADDGALRVWDATARKLLHTFADPARAEPEVAGAK